MAEEKIQEQDYFKLLKALAIPESAGWDFLYDLFEECSEGEGEIKKDNPMVASIAVNPVQLTMYLANEHLFYLALNPDKTVQSLAEDPKYHQLIGSVALDKYYTNEHLAYRMGSYASRFNPTISTIDLYLNFILGMMTRYRKNDPKETLLVDVMEKGFQMAKCVSSLLENGFETEAFSTWRTLHENECILTVLVRYGEPVMNRYLAHMRYALAFRGSLKSKEETDACFVEIKDGMRAAGLKSKDMKRYIEYGWLLAVPDVTSIPNFKLNFRDGVERVAKLSDYSKVYEMSSEIAHSSPLLIYSNKEYFHHFTLINLYESFFRLEKFFTSLYMATVGEEEKAAYVRMRALYTNELQAAYRYERMQLQRLARASKSPADPSPATPSFSPSKEKKGKDEEK